MNPECLNQNGQPALAALPIGEFNNLKQYLENLLALRQGKQRLLRKTVRHWILMNSYDDSLKTGTEGVHRVANSDTCCPGRCPNPVRLKYG